MSEHASRACEEEVPSFGSFSLVLYSRWMGASYHDACLRGSVVHKSSNYRYLFVESVQWREKQDGEVLLREVPGIGFDFFTFDTTQKESAYDCEVSAREMVGPADEFDAVLAYKPTKFLSEESDKILIAAAGRGLLSTIKLVKLAAIPRASLLYPDVGFLADIIGSACRPGSNPSAVRKQGR